MLQKSPFTPSALGYRMPAEWEPHEGTWISWPYNLETWAGHLEGAEEAFAQIIAALTPHEKVHLLVPSKEVEARTLTPTGTSAPHGCATVEYAGNCWKSEFDILVIDEDGKPYY